MLESPRILENAIEVSQDNPSQGLELARQALQVAELRCQRVRCLTIVASDLNRLTEVKKAAETIMFKGLPGISRQRAHLAWLEAVICIELAEYRPDDTRNLRRAAFPLFTTACRGFHALGLADLHAATWADRGAALALGEPLKFSARIAHRSKSPQRVTPPPFSERYVKLSAPILAGNPSPLLSLRKATKQGIPLLRYPQEVDTQLVAAPLLPIP
jgi:hypothetical protein